MTDFFHHILKCNIGCVDTVSVRADKVERSAVCEDRASSAQNAEGGGKANELGVTVISEEEFAEMIMRRKRSAADFCK